MEREQRIHVLYNGNVQGVGFRFTAERIATKLGLVGYVKNLADGSVEAVCEGKKRTLEEFLESVYGSMGGYISSTEVQWMPSAMEFSSFDIKLW